MTSPTKIKKLSSKIWMSERMWAAWEETRKAFEKEFPHAAKLRITQGAFMAEIGGADPDSAHYHDFSGALDVVTSDMVTGEGKSTAQSEGFIRIARSIGWAAWLRGPHAPYGGFEKVHFHLALLGEPEFVGGERFVYASLIRQMKAYQEPGGHGLGHDGGDGLSHSGDGVFPDYHPRPHPIPEFDYDAWENDMQLTDKVKLHPATAEALGTAEMTVGGLLEIAARNAAGAVKLTDKVKLHPATAEALGKTEISVGGLLELAARNAALAAHADTADPG